MLTFGKLQARAGGRSVAAALLAAGALLVAVAWLRGAEYDEQYTLFMTGGIARPTWPAAAFSAGDVRTLQAPQVDLAGIAQDLRYTDVHPPLYFWTVAGWRWLVCDTLFATRLLSVLCSVVTLGLVATVARAAGTPPVTAILLTLGCYGFAYTGAIARGFALAQMLSVAGIAALLLADRRPGAALGWLAGVLLGAATFANYLAAFVTCAGLLWSFAIQHAHRRRVLFGCAIWLPADLWFFLAQRQARIGQFAPFDAVSVVERLAQYSVANVFGGLPLYVTGNTRIVVELLLAALGMTLVALLVVRWGSIGTPPIRWLLAMAAAAPPVGLLLLGLAFDNTPVELRYLAFATPFAGLLLAAALPSRLVQAVLLIQAVALIGLMTRPETMQPARATAAAATRLVRDGVVLLPRGNDGVGIVGAFALEAPPTMRLLVIAPDATPTQIRTHAGAFPRVVLALLGQDAGSRATLPIIQSAFVHRCWRAVGEGYSVVTFERICREE